MAWDRLYWTELQAVLTAREPCELPVWKGSLLRGAFGHRLRRVSEPVVAGGGTGEPDAFACLWESREGPRGSSLKPLILLPPETHGDRRTCFRKGDQFTFGIRILGGPGTFAPLVAEALAGEWRLGVSRHPWEATTVAVLELASTGVCFHSPAEWDSWPVISGNDILPLLPARPACTVRFTVPVDLKASGRRAERPSGETLARRAVDRVADVVKTFCGGSSRDEIADVLALTQSIGTGRNELGRETWDRYSSTTGEKHPLTGLLGELELLDIPAPVWPYLALAQFLHIGKGASFGQGAFQLR